ncbi:MAG: multidrug efflux SMR transporter [Dehalococcoidia bacterium]|nr:multidrug efflux SMR transporter [Dehalococcoidia bacterium]
MHWLLLALAIVLEVCGTTCMKLSEGFSRLVPSILLFVFYVLSFTAFVYALKRIDVSVAYGIWAALGIFLISAIGIAYFKEPLTPVKVISTVLIVAGVVGLYSSQPVR